MERSKAKEAGRNKLVREKANALKDKPPRKAPTKEVIKQAGRYHAIETARKQLNDAWQAVAPDQEQQPYTAVDKGESYSVNAAHEVLQTIPSGQRKGRHPTEKNSFHGETDYREEMPTKPTPKERMRREAVKEFKKRRREQAQNAFHRETHFEGITSAPEPPENPIYAAKRRGMNTPAQRKASEKAARQNQSIISTHPSTGQRYTALPRDTSSPAAKAQIVKEQGRKLARNQAIQEFKTGTAKGAGKAGGELFRKLGTALTTAVTPDRKALLYAAAALILIIVPFVVILSVASMLTGSGEGRSAYIPVSAEVESYRPLIRQYAAQYGVPEYEDLIAAVMMQESGGQGTDPMQCSESGYNTEYPREPGGITDPEYSIQVGVQALADVLSMARVESPVDLDGISLALQGYNYGPSYIFWALNNYGGYSELNAIEYSDMMAEQYGWSGYGDKAYVSHVLRYYPIGRSFMAEGNTAIVAVAQTQIGNEGGLKYCEWYGYPYRVEWCAIFVSWCADQCGYLDAGVLPKELNVIPYVEWFREREQWQGRDYEPIPGDLIFYDWESDGLADHVGIVERVEDGVVYSIEGNAGDRCIENSHDLGASPIYGYGVPVY